MANQFGRLEYNEYLFGPLTNTSARGTPVYDDAGRTVVAVRWTITAKGIAAAALAGDSDANDHFDRLRRKLTEPGQYLRFDSKGFGLPIDLNRGGQPDYNWGPKPRLVSWVPVGHQTAVEFVWECEFEIAECEGSATYGISGFNYGVSWSIDAGGFSRRQVTGYLEIIGVPGYSADEYRDWLLLPFLPGFSRDQNYTLSADKRRLMFAITDDQHRTANAFPPGVKNIRGWHRAQINRRSRPRVDNILTVQIELMQDQPRTLAWEIFRDIFGKRLQHPVDNDHTTMFESLNIGEDLFGTLYTFDAGYRVFASDLPDIIDHVGLYTSLEFDWQAWSASMANVVDHRGHGNLADNPQDDKLVNACDQDLPIIQEGVSLLLPPEPVPATTLQNYKPDPEKSYMHFESSLEELTDYKKAYSIELGPVIADKQAFDPTISTGALAPIDGLGSLESVIAEAAPSQMWRWMGYAERLGYQIPTPDLLTVDGVVLEKVGQSTMESKHKGDYFGQPLYSLLWDLVYRVVDRPGELPTANPDPNA